MKQNNQIIRKVTIVSVAVNLGLSLMKLMAGLAFHSMALISDAIHSSTDLITDFVVLVGYKASNKPADDDHHFGHGKYETFSRLILAGFILVAAGGIFYYSIESILQQRANPSGWPVLIAAAISFLANEALFQWSRKLAIRIKSKLLLANAWHHRSDGLSSLVVVIGGGLILFDVKYADAVSGIAVGVMVGAVGFKFLKESLRELSESSPGQEAENKLKEILEKNPDVISYHNVRLRAMGSSVFMDMHILVQPDLTLIQAHDIAEDLEMQIKQAFDEETDVLVHVEPYEIDHKDLE